MRYRFAILACLLVQSRAAPAINAQDVLASTEAVSQDAPPSMLDITIDDIHRLFNNGLLTSVHLVQTYLDRIDEVNEKLRPVGEINENVLEIAAQLDEERKSGNIRGPLHGIPILVKDNIATGDGLNNTAGSVCMLGLQPPRDATVVSKLRNAGAIILGKANMEEWAGARSGGIKGSFISGWSGYGGQVFGAYHEKQNGLGSSTGSAVAVSIGLALAALGTETAGSIVAPSGQNNVVGIKPTLGLTSRDLVIPITIRQDTVGPIAKTVKDAAMILNVMVGKDPADNYTSLQPFDTPPDYTKSLNYSALKGARIGVPRNGILDFYYFPNETIGNEYELSVFNASLQVMREAGATIVEDANFLFNGSVLDYEEYIGGNSSRVVLPDFVAGLKSYLQKVNPGKGGLHSLQDIYNCTTNTPMEDYPSHDLATWDQALAQNFTNESLESWQAYQYNLWMGGAAGVLGVLDKYNLDALVLPTFSSIILPAIAGLPIISVPSGAQPKGAKVVLDARGTTVLRAPNTPFGIGFMGRAWSEEMLIGLAYAFEQRTNVRRKVVPWIVPATELNVTKHL